MLYQGSLQSANSTEAAFILMMWPLHRDIRGIGFIEYADPRDAADAQRELDRMFLDGREVRACQSDVWAVT